MQRNSAFTLLELIMALAVMASVSILVLPAIFGRSAQETRLIESSDEFADIFRIARQRAIDKAIPVCVSITEGTANYRCFDVRDTAISYVGSLPAGITLHALRKDRDQRPQTDVVFREDGSATANEFEVRGFGDTKRIAVERLTGHVTIEVPTK